jgi:hypothetical protein
MSLQTLFETRALTLVTKGERYFVGIGAITMSMTA